jgi:hypothetical protein
MRQGFSIIPFKIADEHGISETVGLAKFSAAGIVLEFEKEFLGLVKAGGVREARIPIGDILEIQFGKGFLGLFGSIIVRFKNLSVVAGLHTKKGRLKLKVARSDRGAAIEVVENMQKTLNDSQEELPTATMRQLFEDDTEDETKPLNVSD